MQLSIWERESFFSDKDVLIIGSGFAGLWTAYEIRKRKPSWTIGVIDRGIIPAGASTRNAGFSCFGSLSELIADVKQMGEENMLQLVEMRFNGLKKIRNTFSNRVIDYENLGGYELFEEQGSYDPTQLEKDSKYLNKLLRKVVREDKTFRLADKKIKKFGFDGISRLVENKLEGQLHSGKLTQALVRHLQKKGVDFLFGIEAGSYEKTADSISISTNHSFSLSAERLVICTNAFTDKLIPALEVTPARGQVLVTSEIPDLKIKGSFHYDEGYYYFRNLGNRILLGGARNKFFEEERTTSLQTSTNIQSELERFLQQLILPHQNGYTIDHRWSGTMGMGKEKKPAIMELDENVFCAVAMGGIGVATAPIVAEQVADLMLKKKR